MTKKEIIEDVVVCFMWFFGFVVLFWLAAALDAGML